MRNAASLLVALLSAAAPAAPPNRPAPDADARFAALEHAYVAYSFSRFPVMATDLDGAAFDPALADVDGTLRDNSPAAISAEDAHLRTLRLQFAQLEPRRLSARRRIDRSVALAQIDLLLHRHEVLRLEQRALDSYVSEPRRGVERIVEDLTAAPVGEAPDTGWQHVIARTRVIPVYLTQARQQLAAGLRAGHAPDWRVLLESGLNDTAANTEYFSRTLPELAQRALGAGARDSVLRPLQQAGKDAATAYQDLHDFIAATCFLDPSGTDARALKPAFRADRFALGESEYDWALHNELHLDTTAVALYPKSWLTVQAVRAQLFVVARSIAQAHHWPAPTGAADGMVRMVFGQLQQNAPATDAALVQAYDLTGQRLIDYARRTQLFDMPANYHLEATLTPDPGRFQVTPTGDDPAQLRQVHNASAQAERFAREGFPGHHWHYRVMAENRARISAVRWLDRTPDTGWSLYAQGLLAEPQAGAPHGFYSPEERLYQLRAQLAAALRVRIDTGIHTGRLSIEDAVTLMSESADFLPGSCHDPRSLADAGKRASCEHARVEVRRCARAPTRAIAGWLGREQILSLRHRAQRLYGAEFSEPRFHRELMQQGTIPAGYFGEELLRDLGRPPGN